MMKVGQAEDNTTETTETTETTDTNSPMKVIAVMVMFH